MAAYKREIIGGSHFADMGADVLLPAARGTCSEDPTRPGIDDITDDTAAWLTTLGSLRDVVLLEAVGGGLAASLHLVNAEILVVASGAFISAGTVYGLDDDDQVDFGALASGTKHVAALPGTHGATLTVGATWPVGAHLKIATVAWSGMALSELVDERATYIVTLGNDGALLAANNLSDLANAATARTNLGLGSAATHASTDFDAAGAAASAQSAAQSYADTNKLAKASNLSDLANAATARTNLGLGSAATHASTDFDAAGAAATVAGNLTTHIGLANPHSTKLTNLSDVTVSTVSASVGNAIALNGAQAVLDGTTGFLDSAQYVVYSCWAKIHTVPGAGQCGILTDYNSDGSKGGGIWLYNGNLYGQMLTSAGAVQTDPVSPPSLDTWHYFELVKSNWSGAGVVALYVDGSLANNKSCFNAATLGTGTGAMRVGSIGITGFDGYFDGSVDEARIGKGTARQTSDVVASYNGGFGIPLSADSNNKVWSFDNALPAGSSLTSGTATYTLGVIGPTSGGTPYVPAYRVATWEANDGPLVNSRALTSVGGSAAYAGNIPTLGSTGIIEPTMLDLTSYALLNGSSQAFLGTHVFVNGGLARVRDTKYGPPTSGAHIVGARWTDAGGSEWECTVAGTPGTWVQNTPAAIATWSNLTTAGNWNGGALLAGYMARDLAMADTTEVWSYHATFGWRGRMAHFASTNGFVSATSTTGMSSNSSPNGAFDKDVKYLWHNFRTISYNGGSNLVGFDGSNYSTVRPAFLGNDGNTTYWGSVTNTINSTTPATLDGSEPASSGDVFDPAAHLQFYFRLTVTGTPTTGSHASRISAWRIHR